MIENDRRLSNSRPPGPPRRRGERKMRSTSARPFDRVPKLQNTSKTRFCLLVLRPRVLAFDLRTSSILGTKSCPREPSSSWGVSAPQSAGWGNAAFRSFLPLPTCQRNHCAFCHCLVPFGSCPLPFASGRLPPARARKGKTTNDSGGLVCLCFLGLGLC
jgi:hypothetical protein